MEERFELVWWRNGSSHILKHGERPRDREQSLWTMSNIKSFMLLMIAMSSTATASTTGVLFAAASPAHRRLGQRHINFVLTNSLPRNSNKCNKRKCARSQTRAVSTASESICSPGYEAQASSHYFLPKTSAKRAFDKDQECLPVQAGPSKGVAKITAGTVTYPMADQSTVDIVLRGLKIGRRLHIPTRCPSSPRVSVGENPTLRSVLAKVHSSVLSAIVEPAQQNVLEFTADQIARVRDEVSRSSDTGERHLSLLAGLFAQHFTSGAYGCFSTVSGDADGLEFTLTQAVPLERLRCPDVHARQLAEEQLAELRVHVGPRAAGKNGPGPAPELAEARMLDYALEFEALQRNRWGVCRVVARSRPRDELWRHAADALFGVAWAGSLVARSDACAAAAGHEVTVVVDSEEQAGALRRQLVRGLGFPDADLRHAGAPVGAATRRLELVEEQPAARAATVDWLGTPMAVRVRTIEEHHAATLPCAAMRAARRAARREQWAERLAADAPLFGFARALFRWILGPSPAGPAPPWPLPAPPSCDRIRVRMVA